ncbi:MAG: twin-arginine translocase TatA/TatE family subunit [Natronomonas sp.]|jgi:sec-independent protein translocase protein TatA|uniref:Sec-independent protein translocase protein TatA n=1 Tax=Natronomonas salsuginis TaxID=2217661 RepID=A0A4U5JNP4_9EURY|nr:twin-arginine translocase TatA/TatE family subunit [Natronomonas salsuginis]MDR9381430.1 twin-arginine translocase TatA/TatE family subunit [Natronomonas sp.]TKR27829.1 twin-arginine translocase TatA/TatE family subunit [Natronomonas salsuginis]
MTLPLFIGGLGPPELLLIAGVFILLFGASKLPKLARSMGTATGEFKKGREEVEGELEQMRSGAQPSDEPTVEDEPEPGLEPDADAELESDADPDRSGA